MIEAFIDISENDDAVERFVAIEFENGMALVERYDARSEDDYDVSRIRLSVEMWREVVKAIDELANQEKVDE